MASERLAADPELEFLDCEGEELGKKGAKKLARLLVEHSHLQDLNLAFARIGNDGAGYIGAALQKNRVLRSLNLRNNNIGPYGCECVAHALQMRFEEVGIKGGDGVGHLTELSLSHNPLGDGSLAVLSKVLALGGCGLHELDLSSARDVSERAWEQLAGAVGACSSLKILKLRYNASLGDRAADALVSGGLANKNSSLRELDLSMCGLSVLGASQLLRACVPSQEWSSEPAGLKRFHLLGNILGEGAAEALQAAATAGTVLQDLDLSRCRLGAGSGAALAQALLEAGSAGAGLRELRLDRNDLGFIGAQALAVGLGACPEGQGPGCQLEVLTLRENLIGDDGVAPISEALKQNRRLKELELCGNSIGDSGAKNLGLALVMNRRLSILNLQDNRIGSDGVVGLAIGLERNSSLQELDLSNNSMGMPGMSRLCSSLAKNGTLSSLALTGNKEIEEEVVEQVQALAADLTARATAQPFLVVEPATEPGSPVSSDADLQNSESESDTSSEPAEPQLESFGIPMAPEAESTMPGMGQVGAEAGTESHVGALSDATCGSCVSRATAPCTMVGQRSDVAPAADAIPELDGHSLGLAEASRTETARFASADTPESPVLPWGSPSPVGSSSYKPDQHFLQGSQRSLQGRVAEIRSRMPSCGGTAEVSGARPQNVLEAVLRSTGTLTSPASSRTTSSPSANCASHRGGGAAMLPASHCQPSLRSSGALAPRLGVS
eukprot:TRINITY_DN27303_c0_g1_i1.p1 TRINITY_DN27303_c0_g1~~TRINITY_DN27303_c0_g1_i1.p1  ORF type:complete len:740 (+),score=144.77 TRINITY_DN27303_c0_g1_i1:47-2221(+)